MQQQPNRYEFDRNARSPDQNGQRGSSSQYARPEYRASQESPYGDEEDFSRYSNVGGDRSDNDGRHLEHDSRRSGPATRQDSGRGQYEDYGSQGRRGQSDWNSYGSQNSSTYGQRQHYGNRGGSAVRPDHQMDEYEPDYQNWRDEQLTALDSDYQEFQKERRKKFSDEFNEWRKNRPQAASDSKAGTSATGTGNNQGRR